MIRTGSICKHKFRKSALYLIRQEGNTYHMIRVKKVQGYPIVPEGRYIERDLTKLEEVDFAPQYENITAADCLRHNANKTNNGGTNYPPATAADLDQPTFQKFLELSTQLSPEWLTCDGELSRSEIAKRFSNLKREWATLERQLQKSVTEDLIWDILSKAKSRSNAKTEPVSV